MPGRIPLPVILILFLVCLGSAVWFTGMFRDGLRMYEARRLAQMDTAPAETGSPPSGSFVTRAPLAHALLGLSSHWTRPPEGVRSVPVLAGIVAAGVLIIDQASKLLVVANIDLHQSVNVIDPLLRFTYVQNNQGIFGLSYGPGFGVR